MAHGEAEHGCARGEQVPLRGDPEESSSAFTGKPLRWACGAVPAGAELATGPSGSGPGGSGSIGSGSSPGAIGSGSGSPGSCGSGGAQSELLTDNGAVDVVGGGLVPRQRGGEPVDPEQQTAGEELHRASSCQPGLPGWAGGHRHGAVRPRVRGDRRQRPPDRWC
ncbi:hypothetical protein ACIBF5_25505 [Micromonospora sp. NPDC050417]|uniref:hypothetical protein n=1 Tax=Micromonospora sp. NPDC050417 TaxID=3364280 RepID=UPI00379598A0